MTFTNTKPSYLKAMAEGVNHLCATIDSNREISQQARELAQLYCDQFNWGKIYGFGMLPNGDYVATLGE